MRTSHKVPYKPGKVAGRDRIAHSAVYWGLTDRNMALGDSTTSGLGGKVRVYIIIRTKVTSSKPECTGFASDMLKRSGTFPGPGSDYKAPHRNSNGFADYSMI